LGTQETYEDKQSRDTHNIGYTRQCTKTYNLEKQTTLGTKKPYEDKQSRDTDNMGYTRNRTKTNNLEKLTTLGTQDTVRRQTI